MYGIYVGGTVVARFVTPMTVRSNRPVFSSDTLSLKRQSSRRSAQRWEIETQLEPLSVNAQELFVDLVIKGYSEAIQVVMPQNYGVIKARTSTGTPTAVGTVGTNSVAVTGNTGLIPKGTFVKFNGSTKVYMTTLDLTGNGTLGVYPNLLASTSGVFTCKDDVIMTAVYDLDTVIGMTYTDGILMDAGTVKIIEVVP